MSNEACTSQSDIVDDCPSLESLPSFVRDAVKNSQHLPVIVEDSLDVSAMLNDVLESSQSVLEVTSIHVDEIDLTYMFMNVNNLYYSSD